MGRGKLSICIFISISKSLFFSFCISNPTMKTASYALALATTLTGANAYWKGFNVQATLANGACKTQSDWEDDFNLMKTLPSGYTSMRVYASSDCNTLENAVPAAIATGGQILVDRKSVV